ncbi:MAG: hypothetical protein KKF27_21905 [Gammaproteobacteria bacterium]|nr:hypothetical protein [Gammaproteobacteria bacterium]MBU2685906.1 hypothetical protein [Gammaproteobacteria bacterium]
MDGISCSSNHKTISGTVQVVCGHLFLIDPWNLRYWDQKTHWEQFAIGTFKVPIGELSFKAPDSIGGEFTAFNIQTVDDGLYPIEVIVVDGLPTRATIFFDREGDDEFSDE